MREFKCPARQPDGTPVVSDLALQNYAESVLEDYKPSLLREPGKINAVHFLESYLGATVDYLDIYYREDEDPVAGAAVFSDCAVLVFDRENMRITPVRESANTVLIDNETLKEGREGFSLFTHLHEGGHLLLHREVYAGKTGQANCRRSALSDLNRRRLKTPEDFREHQANTFAAALAMPRPAFVPYARELIRKAGFEKGVWEDDGYDVYGGPGIETEIVAPLMETFGVSYSACTVQLRRQKLYVRIRGRDSGA